MDVGLVVDIVNEVVMITEDKVSPPPQLNKSAGSRFVQGLGRVGEEVKILLNVQKLLQEEELARLGSVGAAVETQ